MLYASPPRRLFAKPYMTRLFQMSLKWTLAATHLLLLVTLLLVSVAVGARGEEELQAEGGGSTATAGERVDRLSRRACVINRAWKNKILCDSVVSAPIGTAVKLDIGSPNGRYAVIWSDGNPRLLDAGAAGTTTTVKWKLLASPLLKAKTGCATYVTKFVKATGEVQLVCSNFPFLTVNAKNAGRIPAIIKISNFGVVRFLSSANVVLLTIQPGKPVSPADVLKSTFRTRTTTTTRTRTTKTTTTTQKPTTTLTCNDGSNPNWACDNYSDPPQDCCDGYYCADLDTVKGVCKPVRVFNLSCLLSKKMTY